MTTKMDWLDGSKATYQKVFLRPDAQAEASDWLLSMAQKDSLPKYLYLFLADSAFQPDNRITRYRKMVRRPMVERLLGDGCEIIEEGLEASKAGLLFWCIIRIENRVLPEVIDSLREDRGSFLFFADRAPHYDGSLAKILKLRATSRVAIDRGAIDQNWVIADLIKNDLVPIRIWCPSGDRELWIEIYTQSPITNTDSFNAQ